MKTEEFQKRLREHTQEFNELWGKIVTDVNSYIQEPEHKTAWDLKEAETLIDLLCLNGAWIQDRLDERLPTTHHKTYRGSLTKKIRKALNFTT